MGNTILSADIPQSYDKGYKLLKQKQQQQYNYISDSLANVVGKPRLVRSNLNNLQLEQYYISNPQTSIQFDSNVYKLRSSSYSKNIAVVFHHKLLDQGQKLFMVRIQKMKARLNQLQGLNITEALCILEAALNGYSQLIYHAKIPFVITEKMIAINQIPQVRVWLNENYSVNKIMPGIKIRNQNIMIHQAFSAVCQHTSLQQRQAFSDIRFKIAQCQRIVDAKNIITMILQNCNRKAIIHELIQKHMARANSRINGVNLHTNPPVNQGSNIKVPMNFGLNPGPVFISNGMHYNSMPPVNHLNHHPENGPLQKIQLIPEEYIKDDEGHDRIRMMRNQVHPPKVSTFITSATVPGVNFGNPHTENFVSKNPSENISNSTNQQTYLDRSGPRNKSIFGKNKPEEPMDMKRLTSPRLSPIKSKPIINQFNTEVKNKNINAKIGQSEMKINNLTQKINKFKSEFNKTTQPRRQKQTAPYISTVRLDKNSEKIRAYVTPPHYNQNKSPINEEANFRNRNQKERLKSETAIGQVSSKWDRKLSELRDNQNAQNTEPYNENIDIQNEQETKRKYRQSQVLIQEPNILRRSEIKEQPNKNNEGGVAQSHINFQSNMQKIRNRELSPKMNIMQKQVNQNIASTFNLNSNTPKFTNGAFGTTNITQYNGGPPKLNINFNGNPYSNNSYPNVFHGFSNVMQNKSYLANRKSHI